MGAWATLLPDTARASLSTLDFPPYPFCLDLALVSLLCPSVNVCGGKVFLGLQSSHLGKQSMENSMNSSWVFLIDGYSQRHSTGDLFFSCKVHSQNSILWVSSPNEGNKPKKASPFSESQEEVSWSLLNSKHLPMVSWCMEHVHYVTTLDLKTKLWDCGQLVQMSWSPFYW